MINAAIACCIVFLLGLISSYWWGAHSRLTLGERLKGAKDNLDDDDKSGNTQSRSESLVFDYIFERRRGLQSLGSQSLADEGAGNARESESVGDSQVVNMKEYEAKTTSPNNHRSEATKQQGDDLKKIWGIGVVFEKLLNDMGIRTFDELANISDNDIASVRESLGVYASRIEKDNWILQAIELHESHHGVARAA